MGPPTRNRPGHRTKKQGYRLEDADYEGHSLAMLRRIAAALDKRVDIRFLPPKRTLKPA
jgi:hypothetical protein